MIQECTLSSRVPGRWEGSEGAGHLGHALLHCGWGSTEPEAGGAELRVEVLFAVFWSTSSVGSCGKLALHWLEIHHSKRETSFTNSEYYLQKVEKQLEGNIFLYFSPQGQKGKNTAKLYNSCIKGSWYTSLQLLSTENSVILAY